MTNRASERPVSGHLGAGEEPGKKPRRRVLHGFLPISKVRRIQCGESGPMSGTRGHDQTAGTTHVRGPPMIVDELTTEVVDRPSGRRVLDPGGPAPDGRPTGPRAPARARTRRCAGVGAPGAHRAARRHRGALPLGPRRVGLGEHVLLGRGAGRHEELEGVLLRLARRRQLDHGRQVAGLPLGDGALGPHLRRELVEHPRAAGARRRRRGRRALRDGAPLVLAGRRAARGPGARGDAGRGADVPVQQPRRAARAVAHRRGVRADPGARARQHRGGSCSRSRSSASASSPRCCRR